MKDYYIPVPFPELVKESQSVTVENKAKLSPKNIDALVEEILKLTRAVGSGQSDICGPRIISASLPAFKAIETFKNFPNLDSFIKMFNILEQDFGRRFALEAMNTALNFEDFKKFIIENRIEIK